ncbi:abortive infection family protein [Alcanivorax sp.]|uniref:abortive infection family protein n=1 Tax=Alcanivorax sp. TaxID=1872427 RepID=UPI000C535029|nr:abortive infection family protein [Alcanivorax sp.]MBQ23885.1 hypothetical protein [Alcanivorax sp.]|tara:strand:+ start:1249 stop:2013 length:765 start_codon:yes stop_codon:yes gene_type:complete
MFESLEQDSKLRGKVVLALQKAIVETFDAADWKEVGYKAGQIDYIRGHSRLLRSLSWGDDDYGSCVFQAIEFLLNDDVENLQCFLENEKAADWLWSNHSALMREIGLKPEGLAPTFVPPTLSARDVVERALKDTEALLATSGATSGVDRVHTALHGYFLSQCEAAGITVDKDATITSLYKALRKSHPSLNSGGHWSAEIDRILKSFSSVLDTLNQLRNHASVAHANENLLSEADAELVCNASRTILHYLDSKLQ